MYMYYNPYYIHTLHMSSVHTHTHTHTDTHLTPSLISPSFPSSSRKSMEKGSKLMPPAPEHTHRRCA
jgi:hypothetical protein